MASESIAPQAQTKRTDVLTWDDYFMSVAFLTALRSKDPSTQVGACIVNEEKRIVGVGYNGFPTGIPDEALPWAKSSPQGELETKYPYVCHAELNAVLNKNAESCHGCRLYATLHPCNECAKVLIQSGIKEVIFASDKYHDKPSFVASRRLFQLAGVEMRQHLPEAGPVLQLALRDPDELELVPEPLSTADDRNGFSPTAAARAVLPVLRNGMGRGSTRSPQQGWRNGALSPRDVAASSFSIVAIACAAALGVAVGRRLAERGMGC